MSTLAARDRVQRSTAGPVDARIREATRGRLLAMPRSPEAIDPRLDELDREWDIERALEANAASLALAGSALALTVHRRFAALPLVVAGFLLQHAIQGWCPPLPLLRALGFRTAREIELERHALKVLRGDYRFADPARADGVLDAVERGPAPVP